MAETAKATELRINIHGLALPSGIRIADINLIFPQIALQFSPFMVPEGTRVNASIVVSASDIQQYLNQKRPGGISNFRVTTNNGKIQIVGQAKVLIPMEVGAEGVLDYEDGKMSFVPLRAEIAGAKAPDGLVKDQIDKINPIFDLTGLPLSADVKSIEIGNGEIQLEGAVVLTAPIPRIEP